MRLAKWAYALPWLAVFWAGERVYGERWWCMCARFYGAEHHGCAKCSGR